MRQVTTHSACFDACVDSQNYRHARRHMPVMKPSLATVGTLVFIAALGRMAVIPAGATTQPAATVTIVHDAFTPSIVHVRAGRPVTFVNGDDETHTFTSDTAVFDSGNVAEKQRFKYTFMKAGTYPYHCTIHTS